jgi:pimeloyl-ACP methyl ester carboxylesterase
MNANFVLCHGAFADSFAWTRVTPLLEKAGAAVTTFDLPGHSDADNARAGTVTSNDYVAAARAAVEATAQPVILVGHSMGGVVITQTAEAIPDRIAALVYLSAYLPENGRSLLTYSQDPESKLGPGLVIDQEHGVGTISKDTMRAAFFNDTAEADAEAGLARLRPEPLQPFATPVTTTAENFGRVPRYYITTTHDRAVGPAMQKAMYEALPVKRLYTLATDHSSYFSATADLASILLAIRSEVHVPA